MSALGTLGLGLGLALAAEPSQPVRLELVAGGEVAGTLVSWDNERVRVLGAGGMVEVPLALVAQAELGGRTLSGPELRVELGPSPGASAAPVGPAPAVVGAASALWPGAGQALLRERGAALGYVVVDALLVGGAVYMLAREQNPVGALPFIGLDLVIRGYAAAEAVEEARRRRAPNGL